MHSFHALLLLLCVCLVSGFTTSDDVIRLQKHLFQNYSVEVRPIYNQSAPILVHVKFNAFNIKIADSSLSEFSIRGNLELRWEDEFLKWDPEDFSQIQFIHPLKSRIWSPSLFLGNCIKDNCEMLSKTSRQILYPNGTVLLALLGYFSSLCSYDMKYFPFDEQMCDLKLNSLDYFASEVELRYSTGTEIPPNSVYVKSSENDEWAVTRSEVILETFSYREHDIFQARIVFYMQRKPLFFVLNLIIPIVVISFLSTLVFLVPVECGEKLSFSLTALVSLAVFISFLSQQIPISSERVPYLTIYVTLMVLLNGLSVVCCVFVLVSHKVKQLRANENNNHKECTENIMEKEEKMLFIIFVFSMVLVTCILIGNLILKIF